MAGAAVLVGVLGFLALRRRKEWRRKRSTHDPEHDKLDTHIGPTTKMPPQLAQPFPPLTGSMLPASRGDSLRCVQPSCPKCCKANKWASHMPMLAALKNLPITCICSQNSLESDPVLSHIASHLLSRQQLGSAAVAAAGGSGALGSPMGGSGSGSLLAEVQQWEVRWEDIQLEGAIGRGSFGKVSLQ